MLIIAIITILIGDQVASKYVQGEIKTSDNWAFLARFCFLSEEGQFEYDIEFNEDQGVPNLLLYYDTKDQWPSVYKSTMNCNERELVLHPEQNQIVNLTIKNSFLSGCYYKQNYLTTPRPKYTLKLPTLPDKHRFNTNPTSEKSLSTTEIISSTTPDYLEDFSNFTDDYGNFSISTTNRAPIKKRSLSLKGNLNFGGKKNVQCHNARRFRSSRERWWFIAVSNCNGTKGIRLKYKILMTNGPPGDYWHEHFSADEFYILPILMAFSIAYSFLFLAIVICSLELKSRQLLHTTYKIFVFSVILQLFGILLQSIAYLKYATNGIGSPKLQRVGAIYMGASETCFLLLLLLIGKGYTVTRGRLPLAASIKLTIFMCLYVVTYISLFIYEAQIFDPGEVLYIYESPAGYGLIILRVMAWCMFVYSTIFTLKHYPEKSNFYYPFNVCGTLWFIAGPAFILSANSYIDKWIRESVVCAVLQFITFGGHLMFLILTMPSVANKNFPYHVRTTQIGIMELTGTAGGSTIEQFGHHVYEPSSIVREQTVIIPLTRRTEEIFEGMYNQSVPSTRNATIETEPINVSNRDTSMENVRNWSQAKNLDALELPDIHKFQRGSIASGNSRMSENSERSNNTTNRGNFQDYIKDVPIELFTISRMVVENHQSTKNNSHID